MMSNLHLNVSRILINKNDDINDEKNAVNVAISCKHSRIVNANYNTNDDFIL